MVTTTLLLEVFTQRNIVTMLFDWSLILFQKISLFETPFGVLRGNVRTLSIPRCKARGRLPIRHDWTFFAISYGWDVISGNLSEVGVFRRAVCHFERKFQMEGAVAHQLRLVSQNEWLPFRVVSKYLQCIAWFCHTARVWQTDYNNNNNSLY